MKANYIQHYASPYYDPVKAHEYYERTKQLKGRTTSGMSDKQKETWGYVKDQVNAEKKQKNESNKAATTAEIEGLRSEASAARERITAKLRDWLTKISEKASSDKESIVKTAQSDKEQIREAATSEKDSITKEAQEKKRKSEKMQKPRRSLS